MQQDAMARQTAAKTLYWHHPQSTEQKKQNLVRRSPVEDQRKEQKLPDQYSAEPLNDRHLSKLPSLDSTAHLRVEAEMEAHENRKQQMHFAEQDPGLSPEHQKTVQLLKELDQRYWNLLSMHQARLARFPRARPSFVRRRFSMTDDEKKEVPKEQEPQKAKEDATIRLTKEQHQPLRSLSSLQRQSRRVLGPDFPPQVFEEAHPLARRSLEEEAIQHARSTQGMSLFKSLPNGAIGPAEQAAIDKILGKIQRTEKWCASSLLPLSLCERLAGGQHRKARDYAEQLAGLHYIKQHHPEDLDGRIEHVQSQTGTGAAAGHAPPEEQENRLQRRGLNLLELPTPLRQQTPSHAPVGGMHHYDGLPDDRAFPDTRAKKEAAMALLRRLQALRHRLWLPPSVDAWIARLLDRLARTSARGIRRELEFGHEMLRATQRAAALLYELERVNARGAQHHRARASAHEDEHGRRGSWTISTAPAPVAPGSGSERGSGSEHASPR